MGSLIHCVWASVSGRSIEDLAQDLCEFLSPQLRVHKFLLEENSSYLPDSSGAFHFNLLPGFPPYFEMIWSHLWYIFKQSEPKVSQALQHPHLCI